MSYTPPAGDAVNFSLTLYTPPAGDGVNFELSQIVLRPFLLGFGVSGKLGKNWTSDPLNVRGIYQMRMTKRGKVPVKMKFYAPTNPMTEAQQANRQKFADAMSAWGELTTEQKNAYNVRARRRNMFGWGLFIREFYQSS